MIKWFKKLFKRKSLVYEDRKELIKHFYSDIQEEYTEQNIPTNLWTFFVEVLEYIPEEHLKQNDTLGLFEDALNTAIIEKKIEK